METEILIIGGGVSGLYAAYRLEQAGIDYQLCESRDRLGGRIHGERHPDSDSGSYFDYGPSWVWPEFQPQIAKLLTELGLTTFEQYLDGDMLFEEAAGNEVKRMSDSSAMQGSYRITGGTQALINTLASRIPMQRIHLSLPVTHLIQQEHSITIRCANEQAATIKSQRCILSMPPRLIARTLSFTPPLSDKLTDQFIRTATWMAGHAKVIALYESPFWRQDGLSGDGFSHRGPLTEIHDASPAVGGPYALFGFVGYPSKARKLMGEEALLDAVQQQLERMYGPEAATPLKLSVKDWSADPYTATRDDLLPLHGHPEYGLPNRAVDQWSNKVYFAGTEMADQHGGYIEGAFIAVNSVLEKIQYDSA